MNDSSTANYERYLLRKLKGHVNSELARSISISGLKKWLDYYEAEKLEERSTAEMIDNIGNILTKSIDVQNFIHLKSGNINKKLSLLDMKLKQVEVIDDAIKNIEEHPYDIGTNEGNNLFWKNNLEDLTRSSALVNSEYQLAWGSICDVLGHKELITTKITDSKHVTKGNLERIYYPNEEYFAFNRPGGKVDDQSKVPPHPPVRNEKDLKRGEDLMKKGKEVEKEINGGDESSFLEKSKEKVVEREQVHEKEQEQAKEEETETGMSRENEANESKEESNKEKKKKEKVSKKTGKLSTITRKVQIVANRKDTKKEDTR
eukprot:CAMPEP_0170517956 /NCGR_PEP_ID=MMETSP0209-20121228/3762_1 /TAXON_ID=665100 ORGANISM="Litonotus pictus, Strain P1" /NCGR_SAMPLE_ID=MMETSP0209 /ASSEMBLY_ACC=CAM_ASM_000301 /LENGTH=316 /DNA_ID=CAMNT_0010803337 /DNA_START=139 /DNA_END=1090 /DNA_ORIENTATION=-